MRVIFLVSLVLAVSPLVLPNSAQGQSLGNLAKYPPTATQLTITTGGDGAPVLQPSEISLLSGNYYRLKIDCRQQETSDGRKCMDD